MNADELREAYLNFFESKGCIRKSSDLLVPPGDPTVLFTPAGMNQFKEQFLGIGKLEFTRATSCQKCIRTGDIENVGKTRFHMTFFEMLGNFSFGDYFKREAIHWAWEFVTQVLRIDKERLHFTVYQDDEEAYRIWNEEVRVPADRIRRCGEDDNFWPAGAPSSGPDGVCGPCSEIFVDVGGGDEVEIWNLVFTQFNRVGYRQLEPLPKKNIDTGMGLERTAAVLQGVHTNFDIDLFQPMMRCAQDLVRTKYDPAQASAQRIRRIAEHSRTVTFCLHEGVIFGPAKQGYVIRRLLRRAVLDAYQLGVREPVLHRMVPAIVEAMQRAYPDIAQTASSVAERIRAEEENYFNTVERGFGLVETLLGKLSASGSKQFPGDKAFDLYSTYGFPLELTEELAAASGMEVDRPGFTKAQEEHSKTSGTDAFDGAVFAVHAIGKLKGTVAETLFEGYDRFECPARIVAILDGESAVEKAAVSDRPLTLLLDRTVFYGESGGQIGDVGVIEGPGFRFEVSDTQKTDNYYQHLGLLREGEARVGLEVTARVDGTRRTAIQRAHSATHILHAALHQIIGSHAKQAGSKVEPDLLRFDFTHGKAISRAELDRIEQWATERIMAAAPVIAEIQPIEEARRMGAMALFGEKYGDLVRIVRMGDFSTEFCGGCHLGNTGQVGPLRILREESISAGVRRITAVVGLVALEHMHQQEQVLSHSAGLFRAAPIELPARIESLQKQLKELEKAIAKQQQAEAGKLVDDLLSHAEAIGDVEVAVAHVGPVVDVGGLCKSLLGRRTRLAALLIADQNGRAQVVAGVGKDASGLDASAWIREVAALLGGKGGGKTAFAQGSGPNVAHIPQALDRARAWAREQLTAG